MSRPRSVLLGEVVEEAKPGFACGEEAVDGVLQIRMNNVTRDGRLDLGKRRLVPADHKGISGALLRDRDVLFNATNSPDLVGKSVIIGHLEEPTVFSNHFLRLRVKEGSLDAGYLTRWLNYQFRRGVYKAMCRQWVNQATLGREALLGTAIPLLEVGEQRRIAEVLDRADALREQRRKAIALLDDLAQSIFLDMFGDPATNPKQWPVVSIGDLLASARYGTSEKAVAAGSVPILRMGNLTSAGEITMDDLKYLPGDSVDERYLVSKGDILFNRTNSAELVGKTAAYRGHIPMAYAGYLIRMRPSIENDSEYISAFLNTRYAKAVLRSMCKSIIGMANINAKEIQAVRIARPPRDLQRQFSARINEIVGVKELLRKQLDEFDALFISLQSRAFRGELWQDDVNDLVGEGVS